MTLCTILDLARPHPYDLQNPAAKPECNTINAGGSRGRVACGHSGGYFLCCTSERALWLFIR